MDYIYVSELECCSHLDKEGLQQARLFTGSKFDLTKLPDTTIREELRNYIKERGRFLKPSSIRSEINAFNRFAEFIKDQYSSLDSLKTVKKEDVLHKANLWLMKKGRKRYYSHYKLVYDRKETTNVELIRMINQIYKYLFPSSNIFSRTDDVWELRDLPFDIKKNPIKTTKTISFMKITQKYIKEDVKEAIYVLLQREALGTVLAEIAAINRFCAFLESEYSDVDAFEKMDRTIYESYLEYINTVCTDRKSFRTDISHLKSVINMVAMIKEDAHISDIIFECDKGVQKTVAYKYYSEAEIARLNKCIIQECDVQVARALMLHQLLGTRISETLTISFDNLYEKNNCWHLKVLQIKNRKWMDKIISNEMVSIINAAHNYTKEKYGERKYIFVCDDDPDKPLSYTKVQSQMMRMIAKNDLRDDHGCRFGVGTHIFRHSYAKKLTEMHIDDVLIAKLLGHSGLSSLKSYRRVGDSMLAKEMKVVTDVQNATIARLIKEWGKC